MDTHYADTTVVYYRLHGHELLRREVGRAVGRGALVVSNFVRGEYIRGYVTGLIELFYAIKEENSVRDGITWFNAQMGTRNPRKVSNALQSAAVWLGSLEDGDDVQKTLRRLGEYIRTSLPLFDAAFIRKVGDPLNCDFGILAFPSETYQESHILDFYSRCRRIREDPQCDQCAFRQQQQARLLGAGIDLYSREQQKTHAEEKGYVSQAKTMNKAVRSPKTTPSCWYCDRLGDTIIALSAPNGLTILTGDGQSFPALAGILGKP